MGILLVIVVVMVLCLLNSIACSMRRIASNVPAQPTPKLDASIKIMACILGAMVLVVGFVAALPR
jgi:hypothetical protein